MLPQVRNILITKYVFYGVLTYATIIFALGIVGGNYVPSFAPDKYYIIMTFLFTLIILMFIGLVCLCSIQLYIRYPPCAVCYVFSKQTYKLTSNGRKIARYRMRQDVVGYYLRTMRIVTLVLSGVFGVIFTILVICGFPGYSLIFLTLIAINAFFQLMIKCMCELKAYTKLHNECNDQDTIEKCVQDIDQIDTVQEQMIEPAVVDQGETVNQSQSQSY